jgi:hypothetical protein
MDVVDFDEGSPAPADGAGAIGCEACEAALRSPSRETISFLLLDQFTVPVVGCVDHLERFSAICGLTSEQRPRLLQHQPAGGITCPGCRRASQQPHHPVLPIGDGAVAVLACSTHRDGIIDRFRAGLQTQHQLTASVETL